MIPLRIVRILLVILLTRSVVSLQAQQQLPPPSEWELFVASNENLLVRDTFLTQSFSNLPHDNWGYSLRKSAHLVDAEEANIAGATSSTLLVMQLGDSIVLDNCYPYKGYTNPHITFLFAAKKIAEGEDLWTWYEKVNGAVAREYSFKSPKGVMTSDFTKTVVGKGGTQTPLMTVKSDPKNLTLFVYSSSVKSPQGHYYVDYFKASGMIAEYSLFQGSGKWSDEALWSHSPPLRERKALVDGELEVDEPVGCDALLLGSGALHLTEEGRLSLQELHLYDHTALSSSGEIIVTDRLTVEKTLPEKGKWYFISLPFDLYEEGLGSGFSFQDDLFEGAGNYLYLRSYDGSGRASRNRAADNWKVVRRSDIDASTPLMEKNRGYLIALDGEAETTTLHFSSQKGEIPSSFGRSGTIEIRLPQRTASHREEHYGWYLCGNPLPAPLSIASLAANEQIGDSIYLYTDEGQYRSIALSESDDAIAPYSAFFVKAKQSATVTIEQQSPLRSGRLLATDQPFDMNAPEPRHPDLTSTDLLSTLQPGIRVEASALYIDRMPSMGWLTLVDAIGRICLRQRVDAGASVVPLSLTPGFYLVNLETEAGRIHQKIVVNR